jgi:hypothetical protein
MELKDGLLHPKHPERICWGCDKYCRATDLCCREERVPHPIEPFGGAGDPQSSAADQGISIVTNRPLLNSFATQRRARS